MVTLLMAVVLGLGFAYFAVQNPIPVAVQIGQYLFEVPLYIVALGSLFVGLAISWLLSLVNEIGAAVTLSGKDRKIRQFHDQALASEEKVRDLEYENARLRGITREAQTDQLKERINHARSNTRNFFDRLRHNLSH